MTVPAGGVRVEALHRLIGSPTRLVAAACALLALVPCVDVLGDPDLWWHLRVGRWILDHHAVPHTELFAYPALGRSWTDTEWLSEAVFAVLRQVGGLALVAMTIALVTWSGLMMCGARARTRGAGPLSTGLALVLGSLAAEPVTGTRPQMLTFTLMSLTLLVGERHLRRGGRATWVLPPLFALWANLHAGYLFGLAVLAVLALAEGARAALRLRASWRRAAMLALAVVASAAACCLNPSGPRLFPYTVRTALAEPHRPIVEWNPPDFHQPALLGLLVLLLSFAALLLLVRRIDLRDAVLAAAGAGGALLAVRNAAPCVALMLPAWASLMDGAVTRLRGRRRARGDARGPLLVPVALLAAVAVMVAAVSVRRVTVDSSAAAVAARYPAWAVTALQREPAVTRVFVPYADGGYVIEQLWPRALVFIYGEDQAVGDQGLDAYLRIVTGAGGAPSALGILDSTRTDAVLTGHGALTEELRASGRWRPVASDQDMLLWVRDGAGRPA